MATTNNRVLVLDPGETTGWVVIHRRAGKWSVERRGSIGYETLPTTLPSLLEQLDRVVLEKVTIHDGSMRDHGVRVIGVVEFLCRTLQIPLVFQSPAILAGTSKWPIEYGTGVDEHTKDAIRHAVYHVGLDNWETRSSTHAP